ncbi:MAG: type II toxin-antitoxin system Phd/YefM family antitoxin [Nitrospinae bacterium]|nr:type II toxin-antitoxin system Phd/YefM family antitoxin [Nitrospinota bacterium]
MARVMPIIEARKNLTRLPDELESNPEVVEVTRRGKPVLAVLPWETYESLVETLEILGDEKQMANLRKGIAEAEKGKTIPWEKARKQLK